MTAAKLEDAMQAHEIEIGEEEGGRGKMKPLPIIIVILGVVLLAALSINMYKPIPVQETRGFRLGVACGSLVALRAVNKSFYSGEDYEILDEDFLPAAKKIWIETSRKMK